MKVIILLNLRDINKKIKLLSFIYYFISLIYFNPLILSILIYLRVFII
jgi:hypothetical protein